MGREELVSEIKNTRNNKIKNAKIMTDYENIEEITNTQLKNQNLAREDFSNQKKNLNPILEEAHPVSEIPITSATPNLNIEIISSSTDPKGTLLTITPQGLINSKRNAKDGISFFGYEESTTNPTVDYLINPKIDAKENMDERFFGKHFQIRFNPSDGKYYLKDLGHGFGTFVKITSMVQIKNNLLINIGENYIVFTFGIEDDLAVPTKVNSGDKEDLDNMINVKVFSGNIKHDILSFTPKKSPLTIGRSPDCEILIDDSMLSRVHCTVQFKNGNWYITDGAMMDDDEVRKSTNGTWIYAFDDLEITEQMTFKANHNLFICSYEEKNND